MKLRTFLLAVVGLTLIPLLGAAGLAIWWAHEDERRNVEQALLYHARSLTVAVDREVETSLAGLTGLATSRDLDSGELRKFYEEARLARDAYRRWLTVALVDPSGRQVLNLLRPLGSPLPSVAALETFRRTLQTGEPQVSDLEMDPAAGRWVISVTLPLLRDGTLRHILVAVMTPESFASVLAAADVAGGTIVDRKGVVVATTEGQEQRVGTPASAGFVSRAREQDEAVFAGRSGCCRRPRSARSCSRSVSRTWPGGGSPAACASSPPRSTPSAAARRCRSCPTSPSPSSRA